MLAVAKSSWPWSLNEACHGIGRVYAGLDPASDFLEEQVAEAVAQGVVDVLETVEVQEEHGEEVPCVLLRACECLAEAICEQGAVRQAREGVVSGVVERLLLGLLALGNIRLGTGHAHRLPVLVPHGLSPGQHPAVSSVLVQDAVLALKRAA